MDHLKQLHDADPTKFVELTRELIVYAGASTAELYGNGYNLKNALAAFDPPLLTESENVREELIARGWVPKSARHDDQVYAGGKWLIPPDEKGAT